MVDSCKCEINDFSFPPDGKFHKRPWGGYYEHFRADDLSVCFKTLIVDPGGELSVQTHDLRDEVWYVATQNVQYSMLLGYSRQSYCGQRRFDIPRTIIHSVKNLDTRNLLYIHEMQIGVCKEDDLHRLSDIYGR